MNGQASTFGGSRRSDNWSQSNYGGGGPKHDSSPRETSGYGVWRDGKHIVGARNIRLEKELYGDAEDPSKQHTGINFEKYDDIPVEATGAGVPEPVIAFTSPPLDPVLLENIASARYNTPTPVQKYSVPIVAAERDLMACAQVRPAVMTNCTLVYINSHRPVLGKRRAFYFRFSLLRSPMVLVLLQLTRTDLLICGHARPTPRL